MRISFFVGVEVLRGCAYYEYIDHVFKGIQVGGFVYTYKHRMTLLEELRSAGEFDSSGTFHIIFYPEVRKLIKSDRCDLNRFFEAFEDGASLEEAAEAGSLPLDAASRIILFDWGCMDDWRSRFRPCRCSACQKRRRNILDMKEERASS